MQSQEAPPRARTLEEMGKLSSMAFTAEEIAASIAAYRPEPTDIVISPFSKCGTTWLQQTFHCLRTRGDMDFDDISRVTPWIETAAACGMDLAAPQRAAPRGFKSHLSYDEVPKGARYVVALRDPRDAMISLYHFLGDWYLEPGAVPFADFARSQMKRPGSNYWSHLLSWWGQRANPDVLLLTYEDMLAEPETNIRRLAEFSGIPLDPELLALTLKQSSRDFMLAHRDRYEDLLMRRATAARGALPAGSDPTKVRPKSLGPARPEMTPEIEGELDEMWARTVTPETGLASYPALRSALSALRSGTA